MFYKKMKTVTLACESLYFFKYRYQDLKEQSTQLFSQTIVIVRMNENNCSSRLVIMFSISTYRYLVQMSDYVILFLCQIYIEILGFSAVFTEAILCAPQFLRNFQNKSTAGMRYSYLGLQYSLITSATLFIFCIRIIHSQQ